MTNELINRAEKILSDIENEKDPLRQCLHYREAADLLPELIELYYDQDFIL
jgi:hypothetical protein